MMIPGKLKYPERIPIHAANNITADLKSEPSAILLPAFCSVITRQRFRPLYMLTLSPTATAVPSKSHTVAAFILHDKKSYYFKNNTVYNTSENQIK